MRYRWTWFCVSIAVIGILFWLFGPRPIHQQDPILVGAWKIPNSKDTIEFKVNGTLEFTPREKDSRLKFTGPTKWWSDQYRHLHVLQPDEDAPGWEFAAYRIEGKELVLAEHVIPHVSEMRFERAN